MVGGPDLPPALARERGEGEQVVLGGVQVGRGLELGLQRVQDVSHLGLDRVGVGLLEYRPRQRGHPGPDRLGDLAQHIPGVAKPGRRRAGDQRGHEEAGADRTAADGRPGVAAQGRAGRGGGPSLFFSGRDVQQAIPYGIHDIARNTGWVDVGVDHDTSVFAAESVRRWWCCRGRPSTSHEVVIETIAATRTRAGLRVAAPLDPGDHPTGIAISKDRFGALPLVRHEVHGQWNHALLPESSTSRRPCPPARHTASPAGAARF